METGKYLPDFILLFIVDGLCSEAQAMENTLASFATAFLAQVAEERLVLRGAGWLAVEVNMLIAPDNIDVALSRVSSTGRFGLTHDYAY